ncbi:MAG: glycoside hydrolase family 97 catalytic domain-containing protein [Bacteroidaceae bacterium]|nr:glycoside hydrolase family 97 catalytic domain-containing protein [Bacteroidaceae bacterium]
MNVKQILFLGVFSLLASPGMAEDYSTASPSGNLQLTVHLADGQLSYTVKNSEHTLVEDSPLGIVTTVTDLSQKLTYVTHSVTEVNDTYTLPVGKRSTYTDHCNTLSLTVQNPSKWKSTVQFRVYDDGFAFRYVIPRQHNRSQLTVKEEKSRIKVSDFSYCIACQFIDNKQSPNYPYEGLYKRYTWDQLNSLSDKRLNAPALISNGKDYLLLSEAANVGTYCAALLKAESDTGTFSFSPTGNQKDYAEDKDQVVTVDSPACTPWRMAIMGSLATVFESIMTENLNAPTELTSTAWIKPGRSAWYWGGSDGNNKEIREDVYGGLEAAEKRFADFAAEMGYEYTLVDGGWNSSWVENVIRHANEKGVNVLLWATARLSDNTAFSNATMEATLQKWKQWGVKGIKIDFWEDDSKETMQRMENLFKIAAKYEMLVNFHGCTRPSGLRRTYPHLMTQEAIYGGECNFWAYKNVTADHHINLFFTRNVVGAADYTPGDFARFHGQLLTNVSQGQRLGLLTAFESGIVHISENPENLQYFLGRDIMKRIPTAWDDSKLLEGSLDPKFATIARRHADDWWIAGATVDARTSRFSLDFLDENRQYTAYIYRDGAVRTELKFTKMAVTKGQRLTIPEISAGGFLVQISPDANLPVPQTYTTYEAESSRNTLSSGVTVETADAIHASGGKQVQYLGVGRSLTWNGISADKTGPHLLTLYYATVDNRHARLLVNGKVVQEDVLFYGNSFLTNTYGPEGMSWKMIPVELKEGNDNTITIQSFDDSWAPNFDRLTIQEMSTFNMTRK